MRGLGWQPFSLPRLRRNAWHQAAQHVHWRARSACGAPLWQLASSHASAASLASPPCDVAIIGGGVVGCSVALHLAATTAGRQRIVVFERDRTYQWASAPRSAGGIRQQFSLPVNVELSMYGVEFLKHSLRDLCAGTDVDADVQFRENGYLILASPGDGEATLRQNVAVQHATGADWITLLEAQTLQRRFPWLSIEGLALGAYGERNEGYFDPWCFLQAMRKAAVARGVAFVEQSVEGFSLGQGGSIDALQLGDGSSVPASVVVNAAGPFGGHIVALCGPGVTPLPVAPRRRCMWLLHCSAAVASDGVTPRPPDDAPLTVDPSGVYWRSDRGRGRFLCGVSPGPENDPDSTREDLERVDHGLFDELVWPALAARAPALEAVRVEASWAGFYDYNALDQNGVVGWHPEVPNMLVACGFSGHGLQQAPGVGRACAELLVYGEFLSIDLSCLGYGRLVRGEPLLERGIY